MCTSGEKDTREEDGDVHQLRREENILQSSVPGVQLLWLAWALRSSGSQLHTGRRRRGGRLSEASDTITFGPGQFRAVWKQHKLLQLWPNHDCFQLFQSRVREISNTDGKNKKGIEGKQTVENEVTWLTGAWWHARTQWDKQSMFKP